MKDETPVTNSVEVVKRVEFTEWTELPHPIWGEGGRETEALKKIGLIGDFPTRIWRKGKFSIVPPSVVTFNQWELYDGEDCTRYATLEEAQRAARGD